MLQAHNGALAPAPLQDDKISSVNPLTILRMGCFLYGALDNWSLYYILEEAGLGSGHKLKDVG